MPKPRIAFAVSVRSLNLALLLLAAASLCKADITYYVYETIGAGSAAGTIVTDGNTGALTSADIVGYNLELNNGGEPLCQLFGVCLQQPFDMDSFSRGLDMTVAGSDLTATATQLQFNFSGADNGLFCMLDPSGDFGVLFATGPGGCFSVVSPGVSGATLGGPYFSSPFTTGGAQFISLSGTQVIGTAGVTLSPPQGGSSSAPAVLLSAQPIGQVTGTIGGFGSEDFYLFGWAGGAFSATAAITDASPGATYLFSVGAIGGCSGGGSVPLNTGDNFANTIDIANLAAGQYCIGVDANSSSDPPLSLIFNTPVSGIQTTPEPASSGLVLTGLGLFGAPRLRRMLGRKVS